MLVGLGLNAQVINFPDEAFKSKLLSANSWNHVAENAAGISVVIDINNDGEIQVSEALLIRKIDVYNGGYIQSIVGIEYFTNLTSLNCSYNGISTINVSNLLELKILNCNDNLALTSLNISGLSELEELNAYQCSLTSLNLNGLSSIKKINCNTNNLTTLDLSSLTNLIEVHCSNNILTSINTNGLSNLKFFYCGINQLTSFDFTNLTALEELNVSFNVNLTSINVTGMQTLKKLECNGCQLSSLTLIDLPNLFYLNCSNNLFQTLNLSSLTSLIILDCSFNQLISLEFGNLNGLENLNCSVNQLFNLNIENMINLSGLFCYGNVLEQLDLSPFQQLVNLSCSSNQLQSLDCSMLPNLQFLDCQENQLEFLNIKNGNSTGCNFYGNPTLEYLCVDEDKVTNLQILVLTSYQYSNMTNCLVGSYCSFTPGGNYYTIQGSQKFDSNLNGCDSNDAIFPNLNFNITDGFSSGNIIANTSGDYSIFVGQGTHTITPILENPTYFNLSPSSLQLTFPETISPNNQNFCITPNGVHNDLEVVIIPLIPARPGFDATYKIIYKNKGNSTLSGSVVFNFEDDKMDILSSIPNYSLQSTNQLTYNYTNLSPFESREIIITININSPMEITAVTIDDQLNFAADIYPFLGDEFLQDNNSSLKQIVVGSFDPNDKTCIEGNTVGTEMIGQYIHYIIRFENTGTFPAENIVVKDMIDLTKFDLSTLIPVSSSHSFVTRIASNGSVEFVFENIQLPFDDANNDGYIVFKIKTISGLYIGDILTNKANIYFDYNFPIETNMTSTTIQNLTITDFNFNDFVVLYPNPTDSILNFKIKNNIDISSINIYNSLGQLVLVTTNPKESINVSTLKTGMYFVKIVSNLGESNSQFLKE